MFISVAMCTYNGEKYLKDQLDSIIRQTIKPNEIIISDDKSTDNTIDIINSYCIDESIDIKISINVEQLGSTKNFEHAISKCKGDIIFLADQDDIWDLKKIEKTLLEFKDENVGLVFSNAKLIDENNKILSKPKSLWSVYLKKTKTLKLLCSEHSFGMFLKRNYITGATMAFRRSCFAEEIYFIDGWIHDHLLALLISKEYKIIPINEYLIKYRIHASQQIGISNKSVIKKIYNRLSSANDTNKIEIERIRRLRVYYNICSERNKNSIENYLEFLIFRDELKKINVFKRVPKILKKIKIYHQNDKMILKILVDLFNI